VAALDGVQLHLVDSIDQVMAMKRWAGERREGPLSFDTESAGLNPHRDRNRLIQLGDLRQGWAVPAHGWGAAACEILRDYQGELLAHNSPYDWRVLQVHHGMTPRWERTHDTLLAGHICDSMRLAGLKERATIEVDPRAMAGQDVLQEGMSKQHWTWDTVPETWEPYWTYAALDPVLAAHLWKRFGPQVTGTYREAYDLERATARICANMMVTGMLTDQPFVRDRIRELDEYVAQASRWLSGHWRLDNVNSNQQITRALGSAGIPPLVFTDKGNPSYDKEALAYYRAIYPQHAPLLDAVRICRKAQAMRDNFLHKFLTLADPDGVIHCSIWSCRARTSRMAVTDPAMQTFDRDQPMIRGSFVPRPGHVFVSVDADQIEARLAAIFSQDQNMIETFRLADQTGQNFFQISAGRIYSEPISKKDRRYTWTKNATYAQIYGAGLEKAAVTAGVPVDQMYPVYSGFQRQYPGVQRRMNDLIRQGKSGRGKPYATAIDGRKLYVSRGHEYAILNTEIQGSAAVILKRGLVSLDAAGFGPYLRLPIHDEDLFEAPREQAEEMLQAASRILTDRESFPVPITWAGSILEDRWRKT
jgi:DNA polymerase I